MSTSPISIKGMLKLNIILVVFYQQAAKSLKKALRKREVFRIGLGSYIIYTVALYDL